MKVLLKLMYITNDEDVARIADKYGVDRIFVDLEQIGKQERQGGMDTVQSKHTLDDVKKIKKCLNNSELLVRSNPIYENSKEEIDTIVKNGADVVMLPYFKTCEEVQQFIDYVGGRCRTCLLLETPEAAEMIDDILDIEGIDEIHIGLNDLHLGYKKKFMFELLVDGTVERLCDKFKQKGMPYGFGGIAGLGQGMLPAESIIKEHYRLGSGMVILSRSFCNTSKLTDLEEIEAVFRKGTQDIREFEKQVDRELMNENVAYFEENKKFVEKVLNQIVNN